MFRDREQAGKLLADALDFLKGKGEVIVLAIPRGGVPVAREVALKLGAPLDLIITRKIGAPGNPEFAIGAVSQDGEIITDTQLLSELAISTDYVDREAARQVEEIKSRMTKYRGDKPYPSLGGKVVLIVDDGIATGNTVRAAIRYLRKKNPASIIVATPVAPPDTVSRLSIDADQVVCLSTPEPFFAIGEFYESFEQVSDEEVKEILRGEEEEEEKRKEKSEK